MTESSDWARLEAEPCVLDEHFDKHLDSKLLLPCMLSSTVKRLYLLTFANVNTHFYQHSRA